MPERTVVARPVDSHYASGNPLAKEAVAHGEENIVVGSCRMTNSPQPDLVSIQGSRHLQRAATDDYETKPIERERLMSKIRTIVRLKETS